VSRLGFWLDGVADGALVSTAALVMASRRVLPAWAGAAVLARFALPWLAIAVASFALARVPRRGDAFSGKLAGGALLAGLVLAGVGFSAGALVATAGAGVGLATFAATGVFRLARGERALSAVPRGERQLYGLDEAGREGRLVGREGPAPL
jgi:phosphatidylglycerophosphate synthase